MGWGVPQKGVRKCNAEGVRAGNGSEFWVPGGGTTATGRGVCSNNPLASPEPRGTLGQGTYHLYCTNQAKAGARTSPSKGQIEEGPMRPH